MTFYQVHIEKDNWERVNWVKYWWLLAGGYKVRIVNDKLFHKIFGRTK